jgi:hypothetical protein
MTALSRQLINAEKGSRECRPLSPPQTPGLNMSSAEDSLLHEVEKPVACEKRATAEGDGLDALKKVGVLVARQRGLQAEAFVNGLMALLASEGVKSRAPENPFDDAVVHMSDSEEFQHVSSEASSRRTTMASPEWSWSSASLVLMSLPESEDSTQVEERQDGKRARQCTSMSGTWAGMRDADGDERRSSRSSVLTAIRKPSKERVGPSGKEQRGGWKKRLRAKRD